MKLWWEPRGFAFVEFVDSVDASEAQYHMNRQMFSGREITVVLAAATRKRPEDMRRRTRVRGYSDHEGRRTSRYGWSHSRSRSRSRSPRHRGRARSRSYSPAPRRRDDYSASPKRKEERQAKSPRRSKEHDVDKKRRYYTPDDRNGRRDADNGYKERSATPDGEGSRPRRRSPRPSSVTPPGSRSRSADDTPARSN